MANKSQTSGGLVDFSITVSAAWQRVLPEDNTRGALELMNAGANNMGLYWAPLGNNKTVPTPTGIGSKGVFTLVPTGSFEPAGGFIPTNELWVIGTASDNFTCMSTKAPS